MIRTCDTTFLPSWRLHYRLRSKYRPKYRHRDDALKSLQVQSTLHRIRSDRANTALP